MAAFLPALGAFLARPEVITGLFGLGASAANHFSQRALSNNAYRQNIAMWHQQNLYNSPSAQVGRLMAAGLNPALAYGGSSQVVGNSETPPQLDYAGVAQQPLVSPDAVMQAQQIASMVKDRALTQQEIELKSAQAASEIARSKILGEESTYAKQFVAEKLRAATLMNDKTYLDCQQVSETIDNLIASRNLTKEQIYSLELANEFNDRTMEYRVQATEFMNRETLARVRELNARCAKYSAEISVMQQTAKKLLTENQFLPRMLIQDLSKGMEQVNSMRKNQEYLDSQIRELSVKTGIEEKELKNWFWTRIVMPTDQALAKDITGLVGAGAILAR